MAIVKEGSGRLQDAERIIKSKGVMDSSTVEKSETGEAIRYFVQGAQQQEYYTQSGLSYFKQSLDAARADVTREYQNAISTLRPQETASRKALDEMMRFIGVDPAAATVGVSDRIKGLNPEVDTSGLASLIQRAEQERDPAKRAALKSQIDEAFGQTESAFNQNLEQRLSKEMSTLSKPVYTDPGPAPQWKEFSDQNVYSTRNYVRGGDEIVAAYERASRDHQNKVSAAQQLYQQQLTEYERQKEMMKNEMTAANTENLNQLSDLRNQFSNQYTSEYDKAYTGDQVMEKLSQTPGYQFQLEAGTKAIERQGAARGMLGSANTLLALQQYGQDLASNYYSNHLSNLGNIAQMGSGAVGKIADLYSQKGGLLAQINSQKGAATQEAYNLIGSAYMDAFSKSGDISYDASKNYAAQKLAAQESAKARAGSIAQTILQNEPAMRQLDQSAGAAAGLAQAAAEEDAKDRRLERDQQSKEGEQQSSISWWTQNSPDSGSSVSSQKASGQGTGGQGGSGSGQSSGGSGGGASV